MCSVSAVELSNAFGKLVSREQKCFSRRLKAASVAFGLRSGSRKLFLSDGPAVEKVRRSYVLSLFAPVFVCCSFALMLLCVSDVGYILASDFALLRLLT